MVLLRSLPEFSTMCISAVDFFGDAMICKGSVFSTIDCNQSGWCDSRDEALIETKSTCQRTIEDESSCRYGDLLDTQSLSSSVHHLIHDSSSHSRRHQVKKSSRKPKVSIFRSRGTVDDSTQAPCVVNELNRCAAWALDDYSFDSECLVQDSESKAEIREVHWEDRVLDSEVFQTKSGLNIFRPKSVPTPASLDDSLVNKLQRCTAWSADDSSIAIDNHSYCEKRDSPVSSKAEKIIHWDSLVYGTIQ